MRKLLPAVAVLFAAVIYIATKSKEKPVVDPSQSIELAGPTKMQQVRAQAIPAQEMAAVKTSPSSASEVCDSFAKEISSRSADQAMDDLKRGVLKFTSNCETVDPAAAKVSVFKACAYDSSRGQLLTPDNCMQQLMLYRAITLARLTADNKDYKNMSVQLLLNKIMGLFAGGLDTPENKSELRTMFEALIEREPNSPEARMGLVVAEVNMMSGPQYDAQRMRSALDGAIALNPDNPSLIEASLLHERLKGDPANLQRFVEENPNSAIGHYFMSSAQMQSDPNAAIASLQRAVQLAPGDERMQKTLEKALRGEKGDIYSFSIGVTFDGL